MDTEYKVLVQMRQRIIRFGNSRVRGYGNDLYHDVWRSSLDLLRRKPTTIFTEGYVWGIAKNLMRNYFRRLGHVMQLNDSHEQVPAHSVPDRDVSGETRRRVLKALSSLSFAERSLLEDRYGRSM